MNQPTMISTADTRNRIPQPKPGFQRKQFSKLIVLTLGLTLVLVTNLNAQDDRTRDKHTTQYWQGVLDAGSAKLTLNIEIKKKNKGYKAIVYSVDQGNTKIPVDKVEVTNKKITLEMNGLNASFEGAINKSGRACKGTFSQNGADLDLELNRVESFDEEAAEELIEFWKGTLDSDGEELEMGLKVFRLADGSLTAKFSSYSQGATDIPVEFEKDGNLYKMKLPSARLEYSGTLDETKEKISGTMSQGSHEDELNFIKTDFGDTPKKPNRPQTPKAPFPYESEEVSYENSKQAIKLAGTLTLPPGKGPFPVAITISGSGATDRDASAFDHKTFLVIADHLARQGIAVLRYDDRGRGGSTGDYSGATSADLATDVEAGIEFLKKHPKIDAGKIGMIGHSEGGLIAPMVAAERDDVHFIVMMAGTGVNGGDILKSQSTAIMKANGESEKDLESNRKVHDAILSLIEKNPNTTHDEIKAAGKAFLDSVKDEATRESMESSVEHLIAILKSEWVSYFVRHDPLKPLAKVKCHVLAMNGDKDLQVLCDLNLGPIEKTLEEGSPASFKVVRLPNMNHVFQETDGSGSPEDYGTIEETFSPKALNLISNWVKEVTK